MHPFRTVHRPAAPRPLAMSRCRARPAHAATAPRRIRRPRRPLVAETLLCARGRLLRASFVPLRVRRSSSGPPRMRVEGTLTGSKATAGSPRSRPATLHVPAGTERPCRQAHGEGRARLPDHQLARRVRRLIPPSSSADGSSGDLPGFGIAAARRTAAADRCRTRVRPVDIDESPHPAKNPRITRCGWRRRRVLWDVAATRRRPVLAADTTVALGDEILGKPADRDDAAAMLARLSGREHEVHTAVALLHEGGADSRREHQPRDVSRAECGGNRLVLAHRRARRQGRRIRGAGPGGHLHPAPVRQLFGRDGPALLRDLGTARAGAGSERMEWPAA